MEPVPMGTRYTLIVCVCVCVLHGAVITHRLEDEWRASEVRTMWHETSGAGPQLLSGPGGWNVEPQRETFIKGLTATLCSD